MNRLRSEAGITIMEVLGTLAVFSVVATGLMTITASNGKLNNDSRTIAAATELAQNEIEKIRMIVPQPNVVPADLTSGSHIDPNNPLTALDGSGGSFTRTWNVTSVSQYLNGSVVGARPNMVQVAVTVSWTLPVARSVTEVTYACTTANCGVCGVANCY
jgi:Tfp pilus assembly protein PilV